MGTFHDDKGELHGITVVAEAGATVYVGRCDTIDDTGVVLLDCDRHDEGEDGKTNADWLQRAARFGVWKKHERLVLPRAEVTAVTPLGDFVRKGAAAARARPRCSFVITSAYRPFRRWPAPGRTSTAAMQKTSR